ncbi:MAG TPA: hypothetical protein VGE43_19575 [Acidimicrobiales bacterium]
MAALEAGEPVYLPVDGSSVLPAVATLCDGRMWVGDPLGVATEQARINSNGWGEWFSVDDDDLDGLIVDLAASRPSHFECRTAVVAYTWVTEHLPAVDADSADGEDTCVYLYGSGDVSILTTRPIKNTDITDRFTAPPSAGQVVLRCEGLVHLEQPITERPCKHGKFSPHYAEPCDDSGRVPLVVPPATITEVPDA